MKKILLLLLLISSIANASTKIIDQGVLQKAEFKGPMYLNNVLTPPQLTASVNNYNPTGFSDANVLRIDANGNYDITGFQAPSPATGKMFWLTVVGTGDIRLTNSDVGSSAANRFLLNSNITLQDNESVLIFYDVTSSRWRVLGWYN